MITKERLKELNKDVLIYAKYYDGIAEFTKNEITEITENVVYTYDFGVLSLCYLFETKEEAEFALKYQNITRPETLSLLNYEDFVGFDEIITNWITSFFTPEGMIVHLYITDDKKQIIVWRVEEDDEPIFEIENTKENYLKACEICRKLFLGESVEE